MTGTEAEYIEYVKVLIKKATPEHDSPMVVDWLPHVQRLVAIIEGKGKKWKRPSLRV